MDDWIGLLLTIAVVYFVISAAYAFFGIVGAIIVGVLILK